MMLSASGNGGSELRCLECNAVADEAAQGWRLYLVDENDHYRERPESPLLLAYCRECAEREFENVHR